MSQAQRADLTTIFTPGQKNSRKQFYKFWLIHLSGQKLPQNALLVMIKPEN